MNAASDHLLHLQVGGDQATSVLSQITAAAQEADSGGMIVAWATAHGIQLLLGELSVREVLERGPFRLVVGTDSITDAKAVAALRKRVAAFPNLQVQMFVHDERWLFHPKLAWFDRGADIECLIGSANLTGWGLRSNWEALARFTASGAGAATVRADLAAWLALHADRLLELDDPAVDDRVAANAGSERAIRHAPAVLEPEMTVADVQGETAWLVSELTKNRATPAGEPMFSQASFSRAVYEDYFGFVVPGTEIDLFRIGPDGLVEGHEQRIGRIKPASDNYYFELGAAAGMVYPSAGSPTVVFCRTATGEFLYHLVLPGQAGFAELQGLLDTRAPAFGNRKRREQFSPEDISAAWPTCPLLSTPIPEP
jgi:HKD family nuclease